jgi:hypothetical protein
MDYWWMVLGFNLGGWTIFAINGLVTALVDGENEEFGVYVFLALILFFVSLLWPLVLYGLEAVF